MVAEVESRSKTLGIRVCKGLQSSLRPLFYDPDDPDPPLVSERHRAIRQSFTAGLAIVLSAAGVSGQAASQAAATPAPPSVTAPMLGVAWYPEQWPETRWDDDLALMERAGIRFVRIGEFAWSSIEPKEGDFHLDWLARAVRAAERHHIRVVMGTPTAAPPAWLTGRYPETLRTLADGSRAKHGKRHQANFLSARFAGLARTIVTKMADQFGHDPNVIGWQLDNEIGVEDRSQDTRMQFQAWLKARYRTLDALNAAWTTSYWSQTYQDWSQIPFPEASESNPGLMLAWRQFVSDGYRGYLGDQLAVLRPRIDASQRVTTNYWIDSRAKTAAELSSEADDLDLYRTSGDLDFAAWDTYAGAGHLDPVRFGATHDIVRGLLRRNFWVMETQPGRVNWSANNIALDPGEVRALAWHAVGHGADAVAYWQWRTALNGQEQYHGTMVGADGTPVPVYDEISRIGGEFARATAALDGTGVVSPVAVLNDYPSRWAIGWQRDAQGFSPADALLDYYAPLHALTRSVDVVAASVPLGGYKLVVAPALNRITPEMAANLTSYVQGGGHLVLGARSGMKDADNSLWPQRQPGPLAALLGARVAQFYALEKPVPVAGAWGTGQAATWAEQLETTAADAVVTLRYGAGNGWLDGKPAAVTRRIGRGSITYVGANLDAALMRTIASRLVADSGVAPVLPGLPAEIDVGIREGGGKRVVILTNYAASARTVALPAPMHDVLGSGSGMVSRVTLPRYGVAVLEQRDAIAR